MKSESVSRSVVSDSATPWAIAHQVPLMEILQARILEWVTIPFSRRSSQPREWTSGLLYSGEFFTVWTTRESKHSQVSHWGGALLITGLLWKCTPMDWVQYWIASGHSQQTPGTVLLSRAWTGLLDCGRKPWVCLEEERNGDWFFSFCLGLSSGSVYDPFRKELRQSASTWPYHWSNERSLSASCISHSWEQRAGEIAVPALKHRQGGEGFK